MEIKGIIGITFFIIVIIFSFLIGYDQGEKKIQSLCKEYNWNNIMNASDAFGGFIFLKAEDSEYFNRTRSNFQLILCFKEKQGKKRLGG